MDVLLFMALARAADWCMGDFKAQDLANTAWAFATMGHSEIQLFRVLATAVVLRVGDFKAQEFANTAWAFVTAGQPDA